MYPLAEIPNFRKMNNTGLLITGSEFSKKRSSANLGLTRTERSVDPCFDRPFRDGPVKALVDSKHLKLH